MGKEFLEILVLGLVIALLIKEAFCLIITLKTLWLAKKMKNKELK